MCAVSFVGTGWGQTAPQIYPWVVPNPIQIQDVSRGEVEALRQEVAELRKLLLAAKEFDRATGQPDCEMDEKVELIKRIAEVVGVDLDDIFD